METDEERVVGPSGLIDRSEYVRLIEQALHNLGYGVVAEQLEQASGIQMQPPHVTRFQECVLQGRWGDALQLLPQLAGGGGDLRREATFLVLQQKYIEALEAGDVPSALSTLRTEMAPLGFSPARLHALASLLMHSPQARGATTTKPASASAPMSAWSSAVASCGMSASGRVAVLQQLHGLLPPSLMLPQARLDVLLEQALQAQVARCQYHNTANAPLSLLADYQAGIESLPTHAAAVAEAHTDEVWHVSFSHGGTMLASASKDKTAIIWAVRSAGLSNAGASGDASALAAMHVLEGHDEPVVFVCWSPDDRLILTVSDDTLRLFDVATGQLLHRFSQHRESVSSCCWLPDSQRFLSGSVDKSLLMLDVSGKELARWKRPYRIQDMVITHDGGFLILASSDRSLHVLRMSDQRDVTLQESSPITSIALAPPAPHSGGGSRSGRGSQHLLVNLQGHTVHLWDVGSLTRQWPSGLDNGSPDPMDSPPGGHIHQYCANEGLPGRYVLRSGFGGSDSHFVVHGSEDCKVYVWHRDTEELLLQLEGHSGTVNCVTWNPANPHMMASASDDKTVRLWVAEAAMARR
ncbi:hypothetical protein FOA52_013609 [Chlamydomonas sp. UWO 241]|nr:hypothetical protein FOA52_013609 [Chlamydomonas sp. UWO 241]